MAVFVFSASRPERKQEVIHDQQISNWRRARIGPRRISFGPSGDGVLCRARHRDQEADNDHRGSSRSRGLQDAQRGRSRDENHHGLQQQLSGQFRHLRSPAEAAGLFVDRPIERGLVSVSMRAERHSWTPDSTSPFRPRISARDRCSSRSSREKGSIRRRGNIL